MLIQERDLYLKAGGGKGSGVLPLTGRSVLISVRRHEANTRTRIKLTCKTETGRQSEDGSGVRFLLWNTQQRQLHSTGHTGEVV